MDHFPYSDLIAMDEKLCYPVLENERINDPANPDQYWQYRFHLNIEDLLIAKEFNKMLRDMVVLSRR